MEKIKSYEDTIFTQEVIEEAESKLVSFLPKKDKTVSLEILRISVSEDEGWYHNKESEFFADYNKGFVEAFYERSYGISTGGISISTGKGDTSVCITMPERDKIEDVFTIFEKNVEKCRIAKQPNKKTNIKADWVKETTNKIYHYCPIAGRKIKSALIKLESDDKEEWQSACMLVGDAKIELSDKLCKVKRADTLGIKKDSVVERLKKSLI